MTPKESNPSDTPQRPISEFYIRGPGPAAYMLPPLIGKPRHGLTHNILPEYTMRARLEEIKSRYPIPGAAEYTIDHGLKCNGRYLGPSYTIKPRNDPKEEVKSPGPACRGLPPVNLYRQKLPEYTVRSRPAYYKREVRPGPNSYLLPRLIGPTIINKQTIGEVTMKGKPGLQKKENTWPGPANYNPISPDKLRIKNPEYTIRTKAFGVKKWEPLCSPASYSPTRSIYPSQPSYPFGLKYKDFTANMYTECDKPHQIHPASVPRL